MLCYVGLCRFFSLSAASLLAFIFLMCDGKRAEILRFLCEQWAAGSKVLWVRTIFRKNSFHYYFYEHFCEIYPTSCVLCNFGYFMGARRRPPKGIITKDLEK